MRRNTDIQKKGFIRSPTRHWQGPLHMYKIG